jgi:hypothetical protein
MHQSGERGGAKKRGQWPRRQGAAPAGRWLLLAKRVKSSAQGTRVMAPGWGPRPNTDGDVRRASRAAAGQSGDAALVVDKLGARALVQGPVGALAVL